MKIFAGALAVVLLVSVGGLLASLFPGYTAVYGIAIAATLFGLLCILVGYKGCEKEYTVEDNSNQ